MAYFSMKELLQSGLHFGHETNTWNPKMKPYIFGKRNGIFIIDLQKTLLESEQALDFVCDLAAKGGTILFVGTKKQAKDIIEAEAKRCGMPYVQERWLGGLLTNFKTIQLRVKQMKSIEKMFADGSVQRYNKKEQIDLGKKLRRLNSFLGGIRDLNNMPDALFVIDPANEAIAIQEAIKLNIPVVALADTDSDPHLLDYLIPGNDDAIRAIQLVVGRLADNIIEKRPAPIGTDEPEVKAESQPVSERMAVPEAETVAALEKAVEKGSE